MSEGELKNRVALQTYYHCEGNMTCATINSEAVKQLLDEAAKDLDEAKTYEELRLKVKWWFGRRMNTTENIIGNTKKP